MKAYESVTDYKLISRLPVYARVDGRAFHTFCRGMQKPFDFDFAEVMQKTCAHLVEEFSASCGYVQSDEISLGWTDTSKVPFETRLFKLQSSIASSATAAFILAGLAKSEDLADRIKRMVPTFDCRVCQVPDLGELANMFLFREMDCVKNSITMVSLANFNMAQIHGKHSDDKVKMLKEQCGLDYYKDIPSYLQRGTYFRREVYDKVLTAEEIEKIPESQRTYNESGAIKVKRSRIVAFDLGMPLVEVKNKSGVLFEHQRAVSKKSCPVNTPGIGCYCCAYCTTIDDVSWLEDPYDGFRCSKTSQCECKILR